VLCHGLAGRRAIEYRIKIAVVQAISDVFLELRQLVSPDDHAWISQFDRRQLDVHSVAMAVDAGRAVTGFQSGHVVGGFEPERPAGSESGSSHGVVPLS